jgi:hypothetical protein
VKQTRFQWTELLDSVNVPSADNGEFFTRRDRLDQIQQHLEGSPWGCVHQSALFFLYAHHSYIPGQPWLLLSSHIDALYKQCSHQSREKEWLGTFDNSLTNTLVLEAMLNQTLPPNTLVVFTGDEEDEGRGVQQVMEHLLYRREWWESLQMVITLDLTAEGFERWAFVLENYFVPDEDSTLCEALKFDSEEDFRGSLQALLEEKYYNADPEFGEFGFVHSDDAGPDESWEYDEYDQLCFSLCLPCAPAPSLQHEEIEVWMHHDHGLRVRTEDVERYREALVDLCWSLVRLWGN